MDHLAPKDLEDPEDLQVHLENQDPQVPEAQEDLEDHLDHQVRFFSFLINKSFMKYEACKFICWQNRFCGSSSGESINIFS